LAHGFRGFGPWLLNSVPLFWGLWPGRASWQREEWDRTAYFMVAKKQRVREKKRKGLGIRYSPKGTPLRTCSFK
jgi:hypothetical protein